MNFHIVEFEASYGKSKQLPKSDIPEIVFSGKSNVGKSSLINKLLYRKKIAKVSATPGKTTTINFFSLSNARFADLPGYGYAKVSKSEKDRWAELVEGYFAQDRNISLIVQIWIYRKTLIMYTFARIIRFMELSLKHFLIPRAIFLFRMFHPAFYQNL